jgi:hypothetical protein
MSAFMAVMEGRTAGKPWKPVKSLLPRRVLQVLAREY